MAIDSAPARRPRRRGRQPASSSGQLGNPAYRRLNNPFEPVRLFSDDQVEAIHTTALQVLEKTGMRVLHAGAREWLRQAGAEVDADPMIVRFDPSLVETAVANAPRTVHLRGGAEDRGVEVGGRALAVAPVGGPPHIHDLDSGKRPGMLADYRDFTRLSQNFDVIHLLGPCVEPLDVPVQHRHLEMTRAQLTLSDKVPFVFARGAAQVADCFAMLRLVRRLDEHAFAEAPHCFAVMNTNSPLQLDLPMAQGIIDFAAAGQLSIITPFTLAGAMAPISIAGALVQQHAEALAGIVLAQSVRAGAPVVYGAFTSNVDMKSGSPAFGTPEFVKAALGSGQLARRIGVPWRSSNANASNAPDAQAAYESQMSLWGAVMGGCNILLHGAGWLEGGLSASFEKFIIDIEMLQMFAELFKPVAFSPDELAAEAIGDVGPGGHFFASPHTMSRYRTAFYAPLLSDWSNHGRWSEAGGKDAARRAQDIARRTLAACEPPPLDPGVRQALDDFVERRKRDGGAAPQS
jgi:trimethylamine--corrinoid protein Co-methyltransferase